jgi:hypothetical protein
MPVPRSAAKAPAVDPQSCAILFNVLLATLLGLYPTCLKKPPFAVRVHLFARVHALLTANSAAQCAFAVDHRTLLVFCLGEYVCRVLPTLFPAEHSAICDAQAVEAYFKLGPGYFDFFRQEAVDSGLESWRILSESAQPFFEKLSRTYRSKCRLPQHTRKAAPIEVPLAVLSAAMAAPLIRAYPCHRASTGSICEEYAAFLGDPALSEVATLHSLVRVADLPGSVRRLQASPFFARPRKKVIPPRRACTLPAALPCTCRR